MSTQTKIDTQVISKQRVEDHGEVYTAKAQVEAMLDLVKHETERVDSRFLEPACGSGNFLAVILSRKLNIIKGRYAKSQIEYERYAVMAIGSIYGVDILEDNVNECRNRLLNIFKEEYTGLYKSDWQEKCVEAVKYILSKNICHGDALTLRTIKKDGSVGDSVVFSEWSAVNGSNIKRRDFIYADLVDRASHREMPLFSDLDEEAYIPEPIKDFPLVHYLEVGSVG